MSEDTIEAAPLTLVEQIDTLGTPLGAGASTAFAGADLATIRAAAVALETEYAIARADLSSKAQEYLSVCHELRNLGDAFDEESREADQYAKKMHASDDLVVEFNQMFGPTDNEDGNEGGGAGKGGVNPELEKRINEVVVRVAARPKRTVTTAETALLVALEA